MKQEYVVLTEMLKTLILFIKVCISNITALDIYTGSDHWFIGVQAFKSDLCRYFYKI